MHHSGELCAYFSMTCRLAQLYPVPLYELRMLIVMEFIIFCDMISLDCKLENELSNLVKALFVFNNVLFSVLHIIIITPSIQYEKKGRYIVLFLLRTPIVSQKKCKLLHYLALHLFVHMHSRVAQYMSLM